MKTINSNIDNIIKKIKNIVLTEAFSAFGAKRHVVSGAPMFLSAFFATFLTLHDPVNGFLSWSSLGNGIIAYMAGGVGFFLGIGITEIPFIKSFINDKLLSYSFYKNFPNKTITVAEMRTLLKSYEEFKENQMLPENASRMIEYLRHNSYCFIEYLKDKDEILNILVRLGANPNELPFSHKKMIDAHASKDVIISHHSIFRCLPKELILRIKTFEAMLHFPTTFHNYIHEKYISREIKFVEEIILSQVPMILSKKHKQIFNQITDKREGEQDDLRAERKKNR